jgi:hypothetical protein
VNVICMKIMLQSINVTFRSDGPREFYGDLNSNLSILPHFVTVTITVDKLSVCYMCDTNIRIEYRTVL